MANHEVTFLDTVWLIVKICGGVLFTSILLNGIFMGRVYGETISDAYLTSHVMQLIEAQCSYMGVIAEIHTMADAIPGYDPRAGAQLFAQLGRNDQWVIDAVSAVERAGPITPEQAFESVYQGCVWHYTGAG